MIESNDDEITISEWETCRPNPGSALENRSLGTAAARKLADELSHSRMLEVTELRTGLMVRTFSYVGRIRLGDIQIRVVPKLNRESLLVLLRYAYGFRRLELYASVLQQVDPFGFEDLLVSQLISEVQEVVARGLHRKCIPTHEWLSSPKGRINIEGLTAQGGVLTASLPCTHHPSVADVLLNQVLLAGLLLAGSVASDLQLCREARRLAMRLEDKISHIQLNSTVMERVESQLNRLTVAYEPAITIIRLIFESRGILLGQTGEALLLPGFLFDMNRFFQTLMGRFLKDNLVGYSIQEEHRLRTVVQYVGGFNPQKRRPPIPRPDFAILRGSQSVALLDAKYRDFWEKALPREMLYQLAIYAASHEGRSATILYPTDAVCALEARLSVQDPIVGRHIAEVCLRPIVLNELRNHVTAGESVAAQRSRRSYAERLALGVTPRPVSQ